MIEAGIIGSTGYTGLELARLLIQHPKVNLKILSSKSYIGEKYSDIYSNFAGFSDNECVEGDINDIADEVEVLFIALPHGFASGLVTEKILETTKVIDLGADFRLKNAESYEKWYSVEHKAKNLLKKAVYGIPELMRNSIKGGDLIANPGCYPTCSILSISPLVKEDLIEENSIIIDAKSGVSGAGRGLNLGTHYTECNESIKAYKIGSHRHTPEIEQALSIQSNKEVNVIFTPHLIPMNRGILSTIYAKLKSSKSYEEIKKVYEKHYDGEYFIRLTKEEVFPETKWVKGSNFCDIGFNVDAKNNHIIIIGVIDNMIKGAAGQAIQNMNIIFDFPESTGLTSIPAFPI